MRFDMICEPNDIERRLTKPNHPWTNGQVERMNRTIKAATVKRFHYGSHRPLRTHLTNFMPTYNSARRRKTLSRHTPYEYLEGLDDRGRPVHHQPDRPDTGTKHLGSNSTELNRGGPTRA